MSPPEDNWRHRAGAFKQQNKGHKHGRHRSKGCLEVISKGRVNKKSAPKKLIKKLGKEVRKHQASQVRKNKQTELMKQMKSMSDVPLLVSLVSLSDDISYFNILEKIKACDSEAEVVYSSTGCVHVRVPRFRQRFTFLVADTSRIYHVLDTTKVADCILFLTTVDGLNENADIILTCVTAQGLPSAHVCITNLSSVPLKKRHDVKQNVQKMISKWLPEEKLASMETESDALLLLRRISATPRQHLTHRDRHPFLLSECVDFRQENAGNTEEGTLIVNGYLRGQTLAPNDLVHITGWKDFRLKKVEVLAQPLLHNDEKEHVCQVLVPDENQESLISENIPDNMDTGEQTWPTDEEIREAEDKAKNAKGQKRLLKKAPLGTSEYQACWIPDADAVEQLTDGDDEEDDTMSQLMEDSVDDSEESVCNDEEYTGSSSSVCKESNSTKVGGDEDFDQNEERIAKQRIKEAREDQMFPDEVDTPEDTPARIRFQKYRGLKSLRTSPWDSKENLPYDYAKIFQFENFSRARKRVLKEIENKTGALPNTYVRLHVEGVLKCEYESLDRSSPLVVFGLLRHEQKMSVLNMVLKQPNVEDNKEVVKSKEELIFQCGFRRFKCCPVFSQHTLGTVHKYERFFHPSTTVVASTFAPITFPPCPVLVFKEVMDSSSSHNTSLCRSVQLIATGCVMSVDPDRIAVKRAVLSGYPFKVNKKSAVVRFMFYNREDIEWFKPIELRTKYGRRGHIKEPLGTHGHMKCVFDKPIKSQDTMLLNLYKRVFPKWTYQPLYTTTTVLEQDEDEKMES